MKLMMAREGRSESADDVEQAQQVTGLTIADLRTGHANPYFAKAYGDDENLADCAVFN